MAAKKTAKKKKPRRRYYRTVRVRHRWGSPEERKWLLWVHDVDTLLHEMVKNPAHNETPPDELVARAEAFADAYHAMQDRRRPASLEADD
jgi:hypothetical protein